MDKMEAVKKAIRKEFHYLFEQGVEFVSAVNRGGMAGWYVILKAPSYQILIDVSRGEMFFYLYPLGEEIGTGILIPLAAIISFLKGEFIQFCPKYNPLEVQLEEYSDMLYPYREQILELFQPDTFGKYREPLVKFCEEYIRRV